MKTLFLELNMGASGDMLMGALFELIDEKEDFIKKINSLGLEDVKVVESKVLKSGISGTGISVIIHGEEEISEDISMNDHVHTHDHAHTHEHECCGGECHNHDEMEHNHDHCHSHDEHEHCHEHSHDENHDHHHHSHSHSHGHSHSHSHHHHNSLNDVIEIINNLDVSEKVKKDAIAIYNLIGEAESTAHNKTMEEVHFHEVGTLDAIVDIVGNCILMEMIKPDRVLATPIHVGAGHVKCAHGIMPVPAPATAYILKGIPTYGGNVQGELCTPTGAAILKHFVQNFGSMPIMNVEKIGYGMGKKDFEAINCVRAFLGTTEENGDEIIEFVCTLDDITGEEIGFAFEMLLENKALDVYITNIVMKKNRPGQMLTVLCLEKDRDLILETIFKYTTTIGVKEYRPNRHKLKKVEDKIDTEYGIIGRKTSKGFGVVKEKFEYEDLKKIAKSKGLSISEVKKNLEK